MRELNRSVPPELERIIVKVLPSLPKLGFSLLQNSRCATDISLPDWLFRIAEETVGSDDGPIRRRRKVSGLR